MSLSTQEKKAIAGILAIGAFIAGSIYEIGKRNFWFEAKNTYTTEFKDADGLRLGSVVTLSGLRVGEVDDLVVTEDNHIKATLSVKRSVADRIRSDSVATAFRAFIIGEKRIDLVPGTDAGTVVPNKGKITGRDSTDLAEFMTGKKLSEIMTHVDGIFNTINNLSKEVNDLINRYRDGQFNKMLSLIDPALENFIKLSEDVIVLTQELKKKNKELPLFVDSGAKLFGALRKDLPQFVETGTSVLGSLESDFFANKLAKSSLSNLNAMLGPVAARPELIDSLLANLQDLSKEIQKNPMYGRQMLETMQELTITLKALQRTWFLEEHAKDVRKENAKSTTQKKKSGQPAKVKAKADPED